MFSFKKATTTTTATTTTSISTSTSTSSHGVKYDEFLSVCFQYKQEDMCIVQCSTWTGNKWSLMNEDICFWWILEPPRRLFFPWVALWNADWDGWSSVWTWRTKKKKTMKENNCQLSRATKPLTCTHPIPTKSHAYFISPALLCPIPNVRILDRR